MKKDSSIIARVATIVGLALGAFALSAFATGTWTAPTQTPPAGNVDAPINVGGGTAGNTYAQVKTGFLTLANFIFNPTLTQHSVTPGSVLTATDDSGTVGWAPASGGSSGVSQIIAGNNITISPTSGTGNVTVNAVLPTVEYQTCTASIGGVSYGNPSCTAYCSAGKHIVGGGCSGQGAVIQNSPAGTNAWICTTTGSSGYPASGKSDGTAICQ